MSLKKQNIDAKPSLCKVTFKVDKDIASSASQINLAGDFNNWDEQSMPMKKLNTGEFAASVNLEKGKEYQFRYVVNGNEWINDQEADKYIPNDFQTENSVVIV